MILIDQETIEQCRKGNPGDFRRLVDISAPVAFSIAFRMIGDEDTATDIVQESMITIWKRIGSIRNTGSYRSWLYRIVLNKCYDEMRRRKRTPESVMDARAWEILSDRMGDSGAAPLENAEIASVVNALSEKLSPKQKAVFILADIEEMSNSEIAAVTGLTPVNVKANLHHARKRIGEMIRKFI
jgi:RNA polymerase sigma-70 factor (ECF subfamily)